MSIFQSVTKSAKKYHIFFSKNVKVYVASLLLSTGKKNCASMSEDLGRSYHSIYSYFDVAASHWAAEAIAAAQWARLLDYIKGDHFEPNRKITRGEVAEIFAKTKLGGDRILATFDIPFDKIVLPPHLIKYKNYQ